MSQADRTQTGGADFTPDSSQGLASNRRHPHNTSGRLPRREAGYEEDTAPIAPPKRRSANSKRRPETTTDNDEQPAASRQPPAANPSQMLMLDDQGQRLLKDSSSKASAKKKKKKKKDRESSSSESSKGSTKHGKTEQSHDEKKHRASSGTHRTPGAFAIDCSDQGGNKELAMGHASEGSHRKSSSGSSSGSSGAFRVQFTERKSSKGFQMASTGSQSSGAFRGQLGERKSSKELQMAPTGTKSPGAFHGQLGDRQSSKELQMAPTGSSRAFRAQLGDRQSSKELQMAPTVSSRAFRGQLDDQQSSKELQMAPAAPHQDSSLDLSMEPARSVGLRQPHEAQGGGSSNSGFRDRSANRSLWSDEEVAESVGSAPALMRNRTGGGRQDEYASFLDSENAVIHQGLPQARRIYSRYDRDRSAAHVQQSMENLGDVPEQPDSQKNGFLKSKLCLPAFLFLGIIMAGATVGIVFATRGGRTVAATEEPSASPTSMIPTSLPTIVPPSWSQRPSTSMSPTISPWLTQARFEGAASSVQLTSDLLAFSNTTHILTYELVNNEWLQVGQALPGNIVRLSEQKRIVVSDAVVARVYDLVGQEWSQVGQDVEGHRARAEYIAISGDGGTIAITAVLDTTRSHTEIVIYDGLNWTQFGRDIDPVLNTNEKILHPVGTAFSFDGKLFAMSMDNGLHGFTEVFRAPVAANRHWENALTQLQVLSGGPAVAMSRDGRRVVTGGYGVLYAFNVATSGTQLLEFELPRYTPQPPPTLALTRDGTTFAYAWNATLQVVEIINDGWVTKGEATEFPFRIDSLAFSSDGRLAVGQPDALEILEHPYF